MEQALVDIHQDCAMMISCILAKLGRGSRYLLLMVKDNVIPVIDKHIQGAHSFQGGADELQVSAPVIAGLVGEESAVQVSQIVEHGSTAAVSTGQVNRVGS